jgi:hypothetical protein
MWKSVNLRLNAGELAQVDEHRGEVPRLLWIRGAIRARIVDPEGADAARGRWTGTEEAKP